ncbi:PREDICTED: cation/H(+) antiporter 15-like [Nelumbo nucifera]|uniref:Cation/H(+) antiporter 15-like n=1 Tax=Nelumbo nucifera TaxID=4432 RepID=A0A1U8BCN8_NELNU|nr:PREDICTED: cation/H(+) antiporter 15-like [Nelumbo nucifera]
MAAPENTGNNFNMNLTENTIICYSPTMITTNGIWQGDNPLDYSLPLFILQLTLVVVITRILFVLLKPLRQPKVISEILGGIILGPSVLGRYPNFADSVFPLRSVMMLETMANVGLLYFLFLVGVEMDLSVIKRTGKKAMTISLAGMVLPFIIGAVFSIFFYKEKDSMEQGTFMLFLGVALSATAFPVLARILAEIKLLNTELGKLAMSASIINDITAWILLALGIALSENDSTTLISLWVILSTSAFIAFCIFVIRPIIEWMIRKNPEGESVKDSHICIILTGVMLCGFITDAIGVHSLFGAFVFGLVIPNGPLGAALIEKLEDFVSGLLLPLFFAISGLRTDFWSINGFGTWGPLGILIILSCIGKVVGTTLVGLFFQMPIREGISLGMLMNTKGLVELIVLNVGRDQKVLSDDVFAVMVIMAVIITSIISPVVTSIYKPAKRIISYKRRTVQKSKPDGEFRMLTCVHNPRSIPTMINLLEVTHPTRRSPVCVYALHLVELTGRASAMLIVHNTRQSGHPALNRTQAQTDHIITAFENFEQKNSGVSVQPLTVISPYSSMHEDICEIAEDKRVALIIVPFHKQQTVDGGMEASNPAFRTINQNVLANAPCSVGILVDRGFSGSTKSASGQTAHNIAVLFFGGPDDREALAYARRMAEHPAVNLTVVRFVPGEEATDAVVQSYTDDQGSSILTVFTENDKEKKLDDEYIHEFKTKVTGDESITYIEKIVNNGEETVALIRSMGNAYDLYIVGRGQGIVSPLTAGLTDWSECPELGAIGDLLASSDFGVTVSVLVVQQYVGGGAQVDGPDTPSHNKVDRYSFKSMNRSVIMEV